MCWLCCPMQMLPRPTSLSATFVNTLTLPTVERWRVVGFYLQDTPISLNIIILIEWTTGLMDCFSPVCTPFLLVKY
jgi:hypothetical protein